MKAFVLAAGLGTRLRPLTDRMPKALVPIDGKPLLAHTLERLEQAGATDIVINVHHFAGQITDYLAAHPFPHFHIEISDETQQLLETGGALKHARPLLEKDPRPLLIHNVDILSNADLRQLYHNSQANDATLLVSERPSDRQLLFDEEYNLRGWINRRTGQIKSPFPALEPAKLHAYAFSGIHVFSPTLFPDMETWPDKFSIIDFYLASCASRRIKGIVGHNLRLLDVGKTAALDEAADFLRVISR